MQFRVGCREVGCGERDQPAAFGSSVTQQDSRLRKHMKKETCSLWNLWFDEEGQDVAEYSVMLAVVLVLVLGTVRLIGSNASNVFSQVGSMIQ
jgi:Flp pilus assembly pilin Flp